MKLRFVAMFAFVGLACGQAGSSSQQPGGPPSGFHAGTFEGVQGGAAYRIEVPAGWNGTLLLWSHGYVAPGAANPASDVPDPLSKTWLLQHGYALAGSAFARTGWAVEDGLRDQVALLDLFDQRVGHPRRTIAWGASTGATISAALVQAHPERISGAVALSGNLAGGVGRWNEYLDLAFALKTLLGIDPELPIVDVRDAAGSMTRVLQALAAAQATPQGQARIALAAALADEPGWFSPTSAEPEPSAAAVREQNELLWMQQSAINWMFPFRAELEDRAGGNPSWNSGVSYRDLLRGSVGRQTAEALYQQAGLAIDDDLNLLDRMPRISADPQAVRYLRRFVVFDGRLRVPVVAVHTVGDGQMLVENEQAYADVVRSAGSAGMLRQEYVHRAGHVTFTPAEMVSSVLALVGRLDKGSWGDTSPAGMNRDAAGLGPDLGVIVQRGQVMAGAGPTEPGFADYRPPPFLRPYDARTPQR